MLVKLVYKNSIGEFNGNNILWYIFCVEVILVEPVQIMNTAESRHKRNDNKIPQSRNFQYKEFVIAPEQTEAKFYRELSESRLFRYIGCIIKGPY
jgi:hypothetical protein